MRKKIFVCLWFLGIMLAVQGRNIIPRPNCLLWADGEFVFDDQTGLYTNLKGRDRKFIRSYVAATLPVGRLKAKAVEMQNVVQLVLADSSADMGTEGYRLMVTLFEHLLPQDYFMVCKPCDSFVMVSVSVAYPLQILHDFLIVV